MKTMAQLEGEAQDYLLGVDRDLSLSTYQILAMREQANLIYSRIYRDVAALQKLVGS